ncbi:SIMPL domain-containing protein [Krasilnikovia sp. MM14-A1004]|uniref:SIMPL domain-containing protein n=1 Tax=Krasilnikovia sp. MM14-A1004 TaxID=3373541 RepID=UPI00399CB7B3
MAEQPMVVVRGESILEVPPEQAVFSVTVSARDSHRETTLARLTERSAGLRQTLDEYPDAIERRETGVVVVRPELKRSGERVSAYAGSVTTTVTVTDFTVLGELLLRLANREQTTVAGPWWRLRPGSTAGAEVRRAAIADALSRAAEYADAVGAQIDRLVEIADEGTGAAQPMMRAMAFDARGGAERMELELDPQPQTVQASVVVRVAVTEPTKLSWAELG